MSESYLSSCLCAVVRVWEPELRLLSNVLQPVSKVKAVGMCSLMGFYHARHALFPDEYIKIITVQTEFLITDLLAIVLCVLCPPHALFIYLHQ